MAVTDTSMINEIFDGTMEVLAWQGNGTDLSPADVLIVDGYNYSPSLFNDWRDKARVLLAVDDSAENPVSCDIVLNHNIYGNRLDYTAYANALAIGGPDYALVGEEFYRSSDSIRGDEAPVLITFGGTDDGRFSVPVVGEVLKNDDRLKVEVVISPQQELSADLQALAVRESQRLTLHHGADMASLMGSAKVLVSAAGYSVIEAMASGLNIVVCAIADNQMHNIRTLREYGAHTFDFFNASDMARAAVSAWHESPDQHLRLDDKGPERVIATIEDLIDQGFKSTQGIIGR